MVEPIAFLSYTKFDNAHDEDAIARFCERLSGEVRMQTGKAFPIFRDKKDIRWGEHWKARIEGGIDAATFLITILTPSYFQSQLCREEYEKFKEREKQLERNDLILSVYYVECDELEDPAVRESDLWFKDLSERQYEDWRNLRWEPWTSPTIGRAFERLAKQIKQALRGAAPQPVYPVKESKRAEAVEEPVARRLRPKEVPTHIVDAMRRGDFATISEALAAAQPGDRILVRPGYYPEGFVVDKPLEIVGEGSRGDVVVEARGSDVVLFKANMGILRNVTLRQRGDGKWYAIEIVQGRLVLEDCDITSQSLSCVAIHGGSDPQVRRNRINDGKQSGVFVYENGLGTIEDNDIFGNAMSGVAIKEGGNPTVRRNRIHGNAYEAVWVYDNGSGTFEDNDLRDNVRGAWDIGKGCKVKRARNQE